MIRREDFHRWFNREYVFEFLNAEIVYAVIFYAKNRNGSCHAISLVHYNLSFRDARGICVNRTENTFGGWRLGGKLRRQENSEVECDLTEYGRYSFNPHAVLHQRLFEQIVGRLTSKQYLLIANPKKLERVHALNTKRARPIDLAKRLHGLGEISVHNAYHHQVLAFAKSTKNKDLAAFFECRLDAIDKLMTAEY